MLDHRNTVAFEGPARQPARGALFSLPHRRLRTLWAVAAFMAALVPTARADVALYQAYVPLQGATEADRTAAFGEALKVAAVRASGKKEAGAAPAIAKAAAAPAAYVQQYATTADRMLKVGFDGRALEQLLQQAGLPLWPAERPVTTVYLFVASIAGAARAVNTAEHPAERLELERAAQLRGVPLAWPAEMVHPAAAATRAAGAGSKSAVLLGAPQGSAYNWTFGHAGQAEREQGPPAAGIGLAADALAGRYAPGSTRSLSTIPVRIGGLADVRDYAALTHYLESLSLVRAASLRELSGSTAQFDLSVRGDLELLRRVVALDGRLAPAARAEGAVGESPDFTWQP